MSLVVHAIALLPAVAALIVVLAAWKDEREAHALDRMRALDVEIP